MKTNPDTHQYNLAYNYTPGQNITVIFCPGFNSNRFGNKAMALETFCTLQGWGYLRFDYSGHGDSAGEFADGCISAWLLDTLTMIDQITQGKVILVGSSMGGWVSLLAAIRRPDRIYGLLLIACAADMTRFYPERIEGLPLLNDDKHRAYHEVPNQYDDQEPYRIYLKLLEDGNQHFLLDDEIKLSIPVRLIHGLLDEVVPWQRSILVLQRLSGDDAQLITIKNGDHRLSTKSDLVCLTNTLKNLVTLVAPEIDD